MESFNLWGTSNNEVSIDYYAPFQKASDIAVLIFPGGAYARLSPHEGEGYAHLLNSWGITAFVVNYRVYPHKFPLQLMDERRAIRFVRAKAEEFGISKNKILVMGSSAGGHLAALVSTYRKDIGELKDELSYEDYLPNGQILCYPVISSDESIFHQGSYKNLLGELYENKSEYSPELLVESTTSPAFIWHTAEDLSVSCLNSCRYAASLWEKGVCCELHVLPEGHHGLGLACQDSYISQWSNFLKNWLNKYYL